MAAADEAAGGDRRLANRKMRRSAEGGIVRDYMNIEALLGAVGRERDRAVEAAPAEPQVARSGATAERQVAGHRGPPDIEMIDRDACRPAGRGRQEQQSLERTEGRFTVRVDLEAVPSGHERNVHVAQTCGRHRIGEDEIGVRTVLGERRLDGERAVIDMPPGPDEGGDAVLDSAIEQQRQLVRADRRLAEGNRLARGELNSALEAYVAAGQVGQRGVGNPGHAAAEIRREPPRHAVADQEAELGSGVDRPEVGHDEAARLDRPGNPVTAAIDVAAQCQVRRQSPGKRSWRSSERKSALARYTVPVSRPFVSFGSRIALPLTMRWIEASRGSVQRVPS